MSTKHFLAIKVIHYRFSFFQTPKLPQSHTNNKHSSLFPHMDRSWGLFVCPDICAVTPFRQRGRQFPNLHLLSIRQSRLWSKILSGRPSVSKRLSVSVNPPSSSTDQSEDHYWTIPASFLVIPSKSFTTLTHPTASQWRFAVFLHDMEKEPTFTGFFC